MSKAPSNMFPDEELAAAADTPVQATKSVLGTAGFIVRVYKETEMKKQRVLHTHRNYLESLFGAGYYLNIETTEEHSGWPSGLVFALYDLQHFCFCLIKANGQYQLGHSEKWENPPMRSVEGSDWEQRVDWKLLVAKIRHKAENTAFCYPEV